MKSALDVITRHRQSGPTKFSHRNGSLYVEYPMCGSSTTCGKRIHPNRHAQHVLEELAAAGFTVKEAE